jgi:hypothetical protein
MGNINAGIFCEAKLGRAMLDYVQVDDVGEVARDAQTQLRREWR